MLVGAACGCTGGSLNPSLGGILAVPCGWTQCVLVMGCSENPPTQVPTHPGLGVFLFPQGFEGSTKQRQRAGKNKIKQKADLKIAALATVPGNGLS